MDLLSLLRNAFKPAPPKRQSAGFKDPQAPWRPFKLFMVTFIISGFIILGAAAGLVVAYMNELPYVSDLREYKPSQSTKIFDANGNLVKQLYLEQRTLVPLARIPMAMQKAIIATEDTHFYQHWGLDVPGILRAALVNTLNHKVIQGASTLTQQLARNLFLTQERSLSRKIKEAMLAIQIEKAYTKDEILEMYLNQVYFGNGAYGVESAARTYFGKHVEELTLSECAVMAGIPKSPNAYNPIVDVERAQRRKETVLARMQSEGYINAQEAEAAKAEPVQVRRGEVQNAPYFTEYVRQQLAATYGDNAVYKGGLSVYTTLDLGLQDMAQRAVENGLNQADKRAESYLKYFFKLGEKPTLQGAMVVIDPHTGYIKALVGGRDFNLSEFNRAIQAKRQPGSAFKPFIYAAAIDNGFTAEDVVIDAPVVFTDPSGKQWKPINFEGRFFGPTPLRKALANSRNVVTVKLLNKIGVNTAISYARRMGITSELNRDLTLALGTAEVSLLELTSAFGTLPNQGIRVEPMAILTVKDANGRTLEEHSTKSHEALSASTAFIVTSMMRDVIDHGTGNTVRQAGFTLPAAGKTGTTNDFSDAWFVGFTPDLVAGAWIGYDDRRSIGKFLTGGVVAAPIWADFMKKATAGKPVKDFPVPSGIHFVKVCADSGQLFTPNCRKSVNEAFVDGTEPTKECELHNHSGNIMEEDLDSGQSQAPAKDDADDEEDTAPGANKGF